MVKEASYGRDEREDPIRVEVVVGRRSRVEVEGDLVATVLGVDVRVYDKRVFDESWQRMFWQEIGWEDSRKCGHVPKDEI